MIPHAISQITHITQITPRAPRGHDTELHLSTVARCHGVTVLQRYDVTYEVDLERQARLRPQVIPADHGGCLCTAPGLHVRHVSMPHTRPRQGAGCGG